VDRALEGQHLIPYRVGETESRTNKPVGQGKGPFLGIVYTQDHLCLHKLMF
jgi:hypothetical protein